MKKVETQRNKETYEMKSNQSQMLPSSNVDLLSRVRQDLHQWSKPLAGAHWLNNMGWYILTHVLFLQLAWVLFMLLSGHWRLEPNESSHI